MTVAVENLSFAYPRGAAVITGLNIEFTPGTVTAITGESGRGKSTLLYLLGLMLRPTSGEVLIGDRPLAAAPDHERARYRASQLGFIFQDAALDATRSVLDNVTEAALYRGEDPRLSHPQATRLLNQMGVDVPLNRRPTQVSGGQSQRIALCRALLHEPSVILADEPTGNLDPRTGALVFRTLETEAANGATVIIVTHSRELANACHREIEL